MVVSKKKGYPRHMFTFAIGDPPRGGASVRPPSGAESAPRTDSLKLPNGEELRCFDHHREDVGRLVALKEAVYEKPVERPIFDWQYFGHPRSHEVRVFVIEHEGELVASTTRFPAPFCLDGAEHPAYFNIDSMVHPQHRRKGRMRDLYKFARSQLPESAIFFSKGSSSQIYPLLLSLGHREIFPNTHLVSYPSAARWLLSRLHLRGGSARPRTLVPAGFDEYERIERFGPDFDAFFGRLTSKFPALFLRDAALMNWRYVDIPHRHYLLFKRVVAGEITSVVVLAVSGDQGHIVDFLWDPSQNDEPERSVRLAQGAFDDHQVARIACFATHPGLRETLVQSGFVDRGETPRFSASIPPKCEAIFSQSLGLHVVDGDGDTEFS